MSSKNLPWPVNQVYNIAYGFKDYLPTRVKKIAKNYIKKQYEKQNKNKTLTITLNERLEQLRELETGNIVINSALRKKLSLNTQHKIINFDSFFKSYKVNENKFYLLLDTNDKAFFTHIINNLGDENLQNIDFLFFGNYEFAGGSICAPVGASELNYSIFNHFSDYHGVNERLLYFKIEYKDNKIINIEKRIISPKVLISGKIVSETKKDLMAVNYFVVNQRLSSRHERWRAQFDVLYKDSVTTNHACHDFELGSKDVAFYAPQLNRKIMDGFVMHPKEITNNGFNHFVETNVNRHCKNKFIPEFFHNTPIKNFGSDLINLKNTNSFYFLFTDKKYISSNHLISRKVQASWPVDKYNESKKLANEGIIYNVYALPVLIKKDFELGVFWTEIINKLDIILQLYSTKKIQKVTLDRKNSTLFPSRLFNVKKDDVILIYPDYSKQNLDLSSLTGPDMIINHNKTNDWDMTEFQSSWRNQQFHNPELPHWLGRQKALNPSCNISGVFNSDIFQKAYLTLVAVPPDINKVLKGNVCIKIYLMDGTLHQVINRKFISPMDVIELKIEKKQKYWFNVRSYEIDFTVNIIKITKKNSVSIQHLWGY